MTLRQLIERHPEWADLEMVIYTDGQTDYLYVDEDGRVSPYEADEMQNIPGTGCVPTGVKLLVFPTD